jgi:hypothetical protein
MWLAQYAARTGLRYSPEGDERWLRAWEPYTTLRTPVRYEHVLESTESSRSLTLARLVTEHGASAWIAIAQDERTRGRAAATSDASEAFREPAELVSLPRRATGDEGFDRVFASFAPSPEDLALAITPGVRRLTLSWQIPVHVEVRPGGFVVAPVALGADEASLTWLMRAVRAFGDKTRDPARA